MVLWPRERTDAFSCGDSSSHLSIFSGGGVGVRSSPRCTWNSGVKRAVVDSQAFFRREELQEIICRATPRVIRRAREAIAIDGRPVFISEPGYKTCTEVNERVAVLRDLSQWLEFELVALHGRIDR